MSGLGGRGSCKGFRRVSPEESMPFAHRDFRTALSWTPRFIPRMRRGVRRSSSVLLLASAILTSTASGEPVAVRHTEGLVHGFLILRTLNGRTLADGDLIQTARGATVTSRLVFRFKDGS